MENSIERVGVRVGRHNVLRVVRLVEFGCYLDGGRDGEVLMPRRYVGEGVRVGDEVRVFVYYDSEDRLVATTEEPLAVVGEVACLTCKEVSSPGAFMDWGLMKDLLVPRREMREPMVAGRRYVVYLYQDRATGRVAGTQWFDDALDNVMPRYQVGEEVGAIVVGESPLGYNVVLDNTFRGLVYRDEVYGELCVGDRLMVYVKKVRDDDRIDVSVRPIGYAKVGGVEDSIVERLRLSGGELNVGDRSSPELIRELFGCSKKSFKMAIGGLYRDGVIEIFDRGIRLRR